MQLGLEWCYPDPRDFAEQVDVLAARVRPEDRHIKTHLELTKPARR